MIEKSCMVCNYIDCGNAMCYTCHANGYPKFEPSELYTAYLAEKTRAKEADAVQKELYKLTNHALEQLERFRQALNCPDCIDGVVNKHFKMGDYIRNNDTTEPCPKCADIRKEAKSKIEMEG